MNEVRKCPWGAKIIGKMTAEKEWLEGKLQSLDLSDKKELIESKSIYIFQYQLNVNL